MSTFYIMVCVDGERADAAKIRHLLHDATRPGGSLAAVRFADNLIGDDRVGSTAAFRMAEDTFDRVFTVRQP